MYKLKKAYIDYIAAANVLYWTMSKTQANNMSSAKGIALPAKNTMVCLENVLFGCDLQSGQFKIRRGV